MEDIWWNASSFSTYRIHQLALKKNCIASKLPYLLFLGYFLNKGILVDPARWLGVFLVQPARNSSSSPQSPPFAVGFVDQISAQCHIAGTNSEQFLIKWGSNGSKSHLQQDYIRNVLNSSLLYDTVLNLGRQIQQRKEDSGLLHTMGPRQAGAGAARSGKGSRKPHSQQHQLGIPPY